MDPNENTRTRPSSRTLPTAAISYALERWRGNSVTIRTISGRTFRGRLLTYDHKRFELLCANGIVVLMANVAVKDVRLAGDLR